MEEWYRDLLERKDEAEAAFKRDYAPYAAVLNRLRGRVLDVGGGAGLAARYLHPSCEYVVLDPSELWTEVDWTAFAIRFRGNGPAPSFVSGVGEAMPFRTGSFDCVLAFWSINHAIDPARCTREIVRVLCPAGFALFVLEDMEPRWSDITRLAMERSFRLAVRRCEFPMSWNQPDRGAVWGSAMWKLSRRPWPLQEDHTRIVEAELVRWLGPGVKLRDRRWNGSFLSLSFERCQSIRISG
jgi:SAM-dependent methyltransferase